MSETNTEVNEEVVEEVVSAGKPTYVAQVLTTSEAQKKVQAARLKAPNVDPLEAPTRYKK
jgi:hypothetical protein